METLHRLIHKNVVNTNKKSERETEDDREKSANVLGSYGMDFLGEN